MNLVNRYFFVMIFGLFFSLGLSAAEYKVAVRAHHGVDRAFKQWQATVDALGNQLPGHSFVLIPIISLNEISRRTGRGEFDFVLTNPSSYVELEELYSAKVLVTLNNKRANKAQDRFGSVIFTHVANSDILSIEDLDDKTLMAVSEPAFGGWRVAWLEMLEKNFDPYRQLKSLLFTPSGIQPDVVYAVRDRKVDAGVVRTDRLERMEESGEIDMRYFRILNNKEVEGFPFFLSTALYPEWAFAMTKPLPEEVEKSVRKTLLSLHPKTTAAISGKYVGWVKPRDYESVRSLMRKLEVGPYAKNQRRN